MSKPATTPLLATCCIAIAGDWDDLTFYTRKDGRIVYFHRAPPTSPPTPLQLANQAKFKAVAAAWHALSSAQRSNWLLIAHRAGLTITGYDLFTSYQLGTTDVTELQTLVHQTGVTIP